MHYVNPPFIIKHSNQLISMYYISPPSFQPGTYDYHIHTRYLPLQAASKDRAERGFHQSILGAQDVIVVAGVARLAITIRLGRKSSLRSRRR